MKKIFDEIQPDNTYSRRARTRMIFGGVILIMPATFVLIHLGFIDTTTYHPLAPRDQFLTREQLWIVNLILGVFGGILIGFPRFLAGALSGLIASALMTFTAILYLSWRENVMIVEIIIPMLPGLLGVLLFKQITEKKTEEKEF